MTRDDVPMRTDAEILEEARRLAREAVDAMVRFLVGTDTDLTGAQRLFKEPLSELRQRGDILSRETWELHAALQVTFGARAARR